MSLSHWEETLTMTTYVINEIPYSSSEFQTSLHTLIKKVVTLSSTNFPPHVLVV